MSFTEDKDSDNYATDKIGWEIIKEYIPTDKKIWAPFYCDGKQKIYFKEMGFDIIHEDEDFFKNNKGDIVIDNPPFSKKKEILLKLKELDKPFILILPSQKINTSYMREYFKGDKKLQIIIPRKRIHFLKLVDGVVPDDWKNACAFDCFYYCYKMNLPNDITWLE